VTDPRLPTVDEVRLNRDVAGASTSEQLRQTQAALAASQQDLTKAANKAADVIEELWAVQKERDLARAELATATRELEQLRALHAHCPTRERP
jgi:septal ring factor EnvC (AmiA/AmiB activator)